MVLADPIFRDAIIFASLLTLLSTGLTLTYLTTKVPNFAHGSFATAGIYVALVTVKLWEGIPYLALPMAFGISGLIAFALYLVVLEPLRKKGASHLIQMIATLSYDLILISIMNILADFMSRSYKVTSRAFALRSFDVPFLGQPLVLLVAPTLAALLILSIHLVLTRTKFGVAMRATIENPDLSGVLGINVGLVYGVSWFLAGGLAGLAGVLASLWFLGNPDLGPQLLPSIFAASISGGLFNIYGAALGGFLVGITEVLGTRYLATTLGTWLIAYRPMIPLTIIIITLLIAPRGLASINWSRIRRKEYGSAG